MHQGIREITIVGKQQKALGIIVQPAYRKDPVSDALQVILYGRSAFRVRKGSHNSLRFIEHKIYFRLAPSKKFSINLNVVFLWISLHAKLGDLSIDRNSSL